MAKEKLTRIDIMMKRIFAHFASIPLVLPVLLSHATRPKLSDDVRFNLCEKEHHTSSSVHQFSIHIPHWITFELVGMHSLIICVVMQLLM